MSIRITKSRLIYEVKDDTIVLYKFEHRKSVYKKTHFFFIINQRSDAITDLSINFYDPMNSITEDSNSDSEIDGRT
ncbi:MAG: hypothetical protein SCH39_02520 [Methanosarcinales archaeon]|nr:hypothetical protein [Methanosarcinales archaeon]